MVHLGVTPKVFEYQMTPRSYYLALKELNVLRREQSREAYEISRFQTWMVLNPFLSKKLESPKELIRFEWEEQKKQTMEEMKHTMLSIARNINKSIDKLRRK